MKASSSSLANFLMAGAVFFVPVFQRNYGWGEAQCVRLFSDVERLALSGGRNRSGHFFGSITYASGGTLTSPEFMIVDGQQRITSVMLLLKALVDLSGDENFASDVEYSFLVARGSLGMTKVKLKQTESDAGVFEKTILGESPTPDSYLASEKKSPVYSNYFLFRRLVESSSAGISDLYEALFRLEVIDVLLEDENPQEVFETMNSTGVLLTNADLLRNFLLMGVDRQRQERLYGTYWKEIERNVGQELMERFLNCYLAMRKRSVAVSRSGGRNPSGATALYEAYKEWFASVSDPSAGRYSLAKAVLGDMLLCSERFRTIFHNDGRTELERAFRELVVDLSAEPACVFLMYLMGERERLELSDADLLDATNACVSYAFRSRIMKGTVGVEFFAVAIRRFEEADPYMTFMERVWYVLTRGSGSRRFPKDDEFRKTMETSDFYSDYDAPLVRYALYKYERAVTNELVDSEDVEVEHVLPQNVESWRAELEARGDRDFPFLVHRIGNLTLTKRNGELSDFPFERKRKIYAESGFAGARAIAGNERWGSEEILERSSEMARRALDLWPLPERYAYGFELPQYEPMGFWDDEDF